METTEIQKKVSALVADIQVACAKHDLNMTLYDGGIGFVDQKSRTIVAIWKPTFTLPQECVEGQTCA